MKFDFKNKNAAIDKISANLTEIEYIKFAYIFGSFVLHEQNSLKRNNFNDIDIAIYHSKNGTRNVLMKELELEDKLEKLLHIPIDVRFINDVPLSFQYNVLKTGILVVDKDKILRSDFESLILKKYFDFVHLRNEYLREIQNASI